MITLDLQQAAEFLRIHEHTLERMARNGIIPGARPGKRWVFLDVDLAEWLRSQYKGVECLSTGEDEFGGVPGRSKVRELAKRLAQPTATRRRNTTTSAALKSGASVAWIKNKSRHGTRPA